jgi:hypothetical protein
MVFLSQLTVLPSEPLFRVLGAVLILVLGHLTVKIFRKILRKIWVSIEEEQTKKDFERRENKLRLAGNLLDAAVIVAAIFYLNVGIGQQMVESLVNKSPKIFSALLIGFLGLILIRMVSKLAGNFLKQIGVNSYLREVGLSRNASSLISTALKSLMYFLLILVVAAQLKIGYSYLDQILTSAIWGLTFLAAALIFYSFKDLFLNAASGVYLKNSHLVRPGEEVKVDGETGEINDVSLLSTSVNTESGYTMMTPNHKIMDSSIKFKRTKSDLETLDDITDYFVPQQPSYCAPAAAEMALEVFGFRHDQEKIGEKADVGDEEVDQEDLRQAIEELTNNDVKTAWVGSDKITDLEEEYKSWFNDGALIISNFYKPDIFPEASSGHFVLSVGVEGEEILNLDPSEENGGVYYVQKETLENAMKKTDRSRGYIVLAPKGTTAHWRIKNDLIYADESLYDQLSKTLESRLRKILRQGRILKNSTPESVEEYIEKWSSDEKLTRVWEPEGFTGDRKDRGGEEDEASEDS